MERDEADRLFMRREPAKGLAFLSDDSVELTAGPHRGAGGSVIALLGLEPEPRYRVDLGGGRIADCSQSELVSASSAGALAELQRWFGAQCDGDWEHGLGIRIETLDNPGWLVDIALADTGLEDQPFDEIRRLDPEREWIQCRVREGRFEGRGGPHMLGRILRTFLQWAGGRPGASAGS